MRIVTVAQMKQMEQNANKSGVSYLQMMENAGTAAYREIRSAWPEARSLAIVAGKGNNGGDGFVVARLAALEHLTVSVILVEGEPVTPDAKTNYDRLKTLPVTIMQLNEITQIQADVVIDALYGTGFHGSLRPSGHKACTYIQHSGAHVAALDVPSGLQSDTGTAAEGSVHAELTIVFDSLKQVHVTADATSFCGNIIIADIGIPEHCHP